MIKHKLEDVIIEQKEAENQLFGNILTDYEIEKYSDKLKGFPLSNLRNNQLPLVRTIKGHSENTEEKRYICLGEISNMPGHVIVVDNNGKIEWGLHISRFELIPINEV